MIKKLLITVTVIGLITSARAGDTPIPGMDLLKEYTLKDKQRLGHIMISMQPYLTQEERNILSDLIKKGMVRRLMDLAKKASEKAK